MVIMSTDSQRLFERGNWLQVTHNPHVLAVGDSPFESTSAIGQTMKALSGGIPGDFIVSIGTAAVGHLDAIADLHGLHRIDRHDGLGQLSVEPRIPCGVRPQSGRHAARDDFKRSADGVAIFLRLFNFRHHLRPDFRQGASHHVVVAQCFQLFPGNRETLRDA